MKVTVTTTVQNVALSSFRNGFEQVTIQVIGANPVFVDVNTTAIVNESISLPTASSSYTIPTKNLTFVSLISTTGNSDVVIVGA